MLWNVSFCHRKRTDIKHKLVLLLDFWTGDHIQEFSVFFWSSLLSRKMDLKLGVRPGMGRGFSSLGVNITPFCLKICLHPVWGKDISSPCHSYCHTVPLIPSLPLSRTWITVSFPFPVSAKYGGFSPWVTHVLRFPTPRVMASLLPSPLTLVKACNCPSPYFLGIPHPGTLLPVHLSASNTLCDLLRLFFVACLPVGCKLSRGRNFCLIFIHIPRAQ